MEKDSQYIYDFNYSLTPDSPLINNTPATDSLLHSVLSQLTRSPLIVNRDAAHFCIALASQQAFMQLAELMLELAELELGLVGSRGKRQRAQVLREKICGVLREVQGVMGRDKQHYTTLATLFLTLLLLRVLRLRYSSMPHPPLLFHLLHWEMKGQHSTDYLFTCLTEQTLAPGALQQLAEGDWGRQSLEGSIAFKRTPSLINSFAFALNKENQMLNQQFRPCFKAIRKGKETSSRPASFADCLK